MSHTFGRCQGGDTRHLPPQVGRPVSYPIGPFSSELTPTLWTKIRGAVPGRLFLGLLSRPPNPDGDGYEELVSDGYRRIEIDLVDRTARHRANTNAVYLVVADCSPPVTHIGLFDETGSLQFYGRLLSTRESSRPAKQFEFRPCALRVIRLRPQDARPN